MPPSLLPRCRPATAADVAFRQQLFASTRTAELAALAGVPQLADIFIAQQFAAREGAYRAEAPQAQCRIVEVAGEPVGQLWVDYAPQALRLLDISLLPGHRGAGIGEQLLRELLHEAQASQRPVELQVMAGNPARRLYLRLGFADVPVDGQQQNPYHPMRWQPDAARAVTAPEETLHAQT